MKNIIHTYLLILTVFFSSQNIFGVKENITNNRENIEKAIKSSRPDLLEKFLVDYKATESEKQYFIDFANKILMMRENNLNLNLINFKKDKSNSKADAILLTLGCGTFGIFCMSLALISKDSESSSKAALMGCTSLGLAAFFAWCASIAKDTTPRTIKQKYLDSIKIQFILNKYFIKK